MKHLLLGCALLLGTVQLHGQAATDAAKDLFSAKRIIKTNLAGYVYLSVSANYEQKVGTKTSVGLLAGYKLPSVIKVEALGQLDGEHQTYTGQIEPQGLFVNPYFRFYTKQAFHGFYLEAFTRYYNYTYLVPYDYDKNGRTIHANLDGKANGMGGGLALGVQFNLAPRVFLDLNAGMGLGVGSAHVQTNDPELELADYQSIQRNIEKHAADADVQIFLLGNTLSSLVAGSSNTSAWADINNKVFPMMRGGISIGYAF